MNLDVEAEADDSLPGGGDGAFVEELVGFDRGGEMVGGGTSVMILSSSLMLLFLISVLSDWSALR